MKIKKYKINKGFIVQKLDNKATIFDGEESILYTFSETATFIFAKIKLGWDRKRIITALIKRYGIKQRKAQTDLNNWLKDLLKKKIITRKTE